MLRNLPWQNRFEYTPRALRFIGEHSFRLVRNIVNSHVPGAKKNATLTILQNITFTYYSSSISNIKYSKNEVCILGGGHYLWVGGGVFRGG